MPLFIIEDLCDIVEGICFATAGLSATYVSSGDEKRTNDMVASIEISGAWHGVVCLSTSMRFVDSVAAVMFDTNSVVVTEDDRFDALCELTNILGGSIKSLLPENCDLALPRIDPIPIVDGQPGAEWHSFSCNDELFSIAIRSVETKQSKVA